MSSRNVESIFVVIAANGVLEFVEFCDVMADWESKDQRKQLRLCFDVRILNILEKNFDSEIAAQKWISLKTIGLSHTLISLKISALPS